jgi:hypothetical protein
MSKTIAIHRISRDMLLQPRASLHRDWIEDYATDMANGASFPPVVVFFDGKEYWLADGFHRLFAREAAGFKNIEADVRPGGRRDALLHSVSANAQHGHRRTNEDKRRAVDIMLNDPEWATLKDVEIARSCMVTDRFVAARRPKPVDTNADEANYSLDTDGEQWRDGDAELEGIEEPDAGDAPTDAVEPFDWEAERLRVAAMDAIRALSRLPDVSIVINAWMKSRSYGEPVETLERARVWLNAFVPLYRNREPERWALVRASEQGGLIHAAE